MARDLGEAFVAIKATGEREFYADAQRTADDVSRGVQANVPVPAATRGAQTALAGLQGASDKLSASLKNVPASVDSRAALTPLQPLQLRADGLAKSLAGT